MRKSWLFIAIACVLQASAQQLDTTTATDTDTSVTATTTTTGLSTSLPTTATTTLPTSLADTSSTTTTSTSPTTTSPTTTSSTTTDETTSTTTSRRRTTSTSPTTTSPTYSTSSLASTTTSSSTGLPTLNQNLTQDNSLSGGDIAGIVVGSVAGAALLAAAVGFCLWKKRRRRYQDDNYAKDQYDNTPYDMQEVVGDAPVSGFSPAAAYRQQQAVYPQPEEQNWSDQVTRQRSMRYAAAAAGGAYGYHHSGYDQYASPNMPDGDYIGHPSDKHEDTSDYQSPNEPMANGAGAGYVQDRHGTDYEHANEYEKYADTTGGQAVASSSELPPPHSDPDIDHPASTSSSQRAQWQGGQLPPPHGLGQRWDLYNYAYAPPSTDAGPSSKQ